MPSKPLALLCLLCLLTGGAGAAVAGEGPKPRAVELRIFDVREFASDLGDFPAPALSLRPEPGGQVAEPEVRPHLSGADLAALIKDRMFPAEFTDPATAIEEANGQLVVMQTPAMQERVAQFIGMLRKISKLQVAVKGLLLLTPEMPEQATFDPEELNKVLAGATVLSSPRIICYHTQRAHSLSGVKHTFVADYDVSGDLFDPVVHSTLEGYVFEVCPTVSNDQRTIDVDLKFTTQANLRKETRTYGCPAPSEPAAPAAAPVPGQAAAAPPPASKGLVRAELDLPELETMTVRAPISIPKGQWVLAGCMNSSDARHKDKNLLLLISAEVLNLK